MNVDTAPRPDSGHSETIHVLWTSGWDSTYRVLDLLHNTRATIQPHYYIATRRPSSLMEIETLGRLRHAMYRRFPDAPARLLTTRFYSVHEIPRNEEVRHQLHRLRAGSHIGTQYETLVNLAAWQGLPGLELSVQKSDRDNGIFALLSAHAQRIPGPDNTVNFALRELPDEPDVTVFSAFRFPLLDLTKEEMREHAAKNGFLDIMLKTWFCHDPIGGKPCGLCAPCSIAMQDGMRRRLSWAGRFRHWASPLYMMLPRHRMRRF